MNIEILRIHEDYVTTTFFFFFFYLNVTEWLASPWWHQIFETDNRHAKRRTECFSEEFLHVCEE